MTESKDILEIRNWLETQEVDGYYISQKSAIIRSCHPFGLFADYKAEDGTIYEGGVEMMTIINLQKDKILSTHYCGAMNRPVAELQSNKMGIIKFLTNQKLSGLDEKKELFVGSWELNLLPNDSEKFIYKYTAVAPNGGFTAIAEMNRIR